MLYLDSSAIVKLVKPEPESAALVERLRADPQAVSSAVARVEVLRALRRIRGSRRVIERAERVLERIALVRLDETILRRAASLDPPALRSLDALHLATALTLLEDLDGFVAYDSRLAAAARGAGLLVQAPA